MPHQSSRAFLLELFDTALARVRAQSCLPPFLPPPPSDGRLILLGAGKAAADMVRVAEAHYRARLGSRFTDICTGLAVTRYGHGADTQHIEVVEAGHPEPDDAGLQATRRILQLALSAAENDLVLVLLSGGGSALLTQPRPGLSLEEKRSTISALMQKGAGITELNIVRKALSAIKGGRLAAAAAPARIVTLAISDVAGDDPAIIASGPTVPDHQDPGTAVDILNAYQVKLPSVLRSAEARPPILTRPERSEYHLIATPGQALAAAKAHAERSGYRVCLLGDAIEGEARAVAAEQAALVLGAAPHSCGQNRGVVYLSGGEVTVTAEDGVMGQGGPNQEFMLALALALNGARHIHALSCDTDGNDGGGGHADDPAGAVIGPDILIRARSAGLDPAQALMRHDSGQFFLGTGDLVRIGPTLTNVNDFRAIMREAEH